ncbi:MAG: trypsin-like peptidase domain-containing protein [Actinomycetota bacterium]|nr:MAG: trypsin-like peptidase domain-containing protein [Actinomycetota bacterium]
MAERRGVVVGLVAVGVLLAGGCGGDDGGVIGASTTVAVDDSAPDTTGGGGGAAVSSLDDVLSATVRIDTRGALVDPEIGAFEFSGGGGSGFFIDPSGIAVTNNHVVTGVAALEVYVGEEDEPRTQVLGVSECSDLAVIDVEGDGFPYLEWYDGEIRAGLDVYAAGTPTRRTSTR